MTKPRTPTRAEQLTARLFEEFDTAAQHIGYYEDQGSEQQAVEAKARYESAKLAMLARLKQLHAQTRRIEKLEDQVASLQAIIATTRSG